MKGLALFDFDGTITRRDTLYQFAVFTLGWTRFIFALLSSMPNIILWKAGLRSRQMAKESLFRHLYKGMSHEEFCKKGQEFITIIDKDLRPEIYEKLRWHLANEHRVIIVSASIADWIRPWAYKNGVKEVLSTEAQYDERTGRMTGRFKNNNCVGEEKVERIKSEVPDYKDYEIWAYGDSSSDEPMLSLADYPYKV